MAKKEYTDAEKIAWLQKKLAAKNGGGNKKAASKGKDDGKDAPKRSGCKYESSYEAGEDSKHGKKGETINRPKIWGWRISKRLGFQSFTAYLGKDDGKPQNGTSEDVCRVFVVNIVTEGVGEQTATGVWSMEHKKLSITKLGLVANPSAPRGGYFGRGGERYKDKVK
jgi:hypothetical protein